MLTGPALPEITLATGVDYDRLRPLMDGRVGVQGAHLIPLVLPRVEDVFFRMARHREFEASEISLSSYIALFSRLDPCPFVALPVFPSRMFRHSSIYVNAAAGISRPEDLRGRTVGVAEYPMTASLWVRGMLQHEYGVHPEEMVWRTGGQEEPGRTPLVLGNLDLRLPASLRIEPIPPDRTLADMLARGEIDALVAARRPSTYRDGTGRVRRLWEDYPGVERAYFEKTGIFPIMHALVLRRDVYERYRWLPVNLMEACERAKAIAFQDMDGTAALKLALPWSVAAFEEAQALFGPDIWPYGVDANRRTLEAMVQYSMEQGLAARPVTVEELFAPETLRSVAV